MSGLGGSAAAYAQPEPAPREPSPNAQARAIRTALARVQQKHSTWTRADLTREMAACLPDEARTMEPGAAVALLHDLTARALAGETEQVLCLEAPEWPPLPDYLRRDLDGRSIYTRPGSERYATHLQLSREEQLLAAAQREGAPSLAREVSAQLLGADTAALEAACARAGAGGNRAAAERAEPEPGGRAASRGDEIAHGLGDRGAGRERQDARARAGRADVARRRDRTRA